MTQTMTISKKIEVHKENKLNHSDISREGAGRPTTSLIKGEENPFNVSRTGYANPAQDRNIPSAMKSRPRVQRTPEATGMDSTWKSKMLQQQL